MPGPHPTGVQVGQPVPSGSMPPNVSVAYPVVCGLSGGSYHGFAMPNPWGRGASSAGLALRGSTPGPPAAAAARATLGSPLLGPSGAGVSSLSAPHGFMRGHPAGSFSLPLYSGSSFLLGVQRPTMLACLYTQDTLANLQRSLRSSFWAGCAAVVHALFVVCWSAYGVWWHVRALHWLTRAVYQLFWYTVRGLSCWPCGPIG